MSSKIVVIGKGEFGNSLVQGLEMSAIVSGSKNNATVVSVEQVSATDFFSMTLDEMGQLLANASYIMFCGRKLSENVKDMAPALRQARNFSTDLADNGPLLEFIDWSNPDPRAESFDGAVALSSATKDMSFSDHVVWKVTGVSSLDIALSEVSFHLSLLLPKLYCSASNSQIYYFLYQGKACGDCLLIVPEGS